MNYVKTLAYQPGFLFLHNLKPIILAGGLTPENVFESIVKVNPTTVYAHTGLGNLDGRNANEKWRESVEEANRGFFVSLCLRGWFSFLQRHKGI
jgi:hypothetical protein